jgi:subtilisin family serine protease
MLAFVACSIADSTAAPRSDISVDMAAKTTQFVIDTATVGTPQDVIVELDIQDRLSAEAAELKPLYDAGNRGEIDNSELIARQALITGKTAETIRQVRDIVFPMGVLGSNRVFHTNSAIPHVWVHVYDLEGLKLLLAHPLVKKVHADVKYKVSGSQNYPLIGQPTAIASGKQGENTRVAVLDSGFSLEDPEFSFVGRAPDCILPSDPRTGYDLVGSGNCRIHDAVNFVTEGFAYCESCDSPTMHGASVAWVAASMAPKTQISALQVFTVDGVASSTAIADALTWVKNNAKVNPPIVAVNMSFSMLQGTYMTACKGDQFAPYIASLISVNVVPVAAVGNDANMFGVSSPACIPGVVAVGAVADSATPSAVYPSCTDPVALSADQVPCFSNGGSLVTLLAPGVNIQGDQYVNSGTSFAAPHVAGAVALLRGSTAFPGDTTVLQTVQRMTTTGKSVRDQRRYGVTTPRLQIDAALGVGKTGIGTPNCNTNPAACR